MSKFREFLLSEAKDFNRPQVTRIVGVYDLPDLGAATQLYQTPVGGYKDISSLSDRITNQAKYNIKYPFEKHGINPSQSNTEIQGLSYEQMKSAMIDLASRIQAIGSVMASEGTRPGDASMSARLRNAHFYGQEKFTNQEGDLERSSANDPNVNTKIILNVDVRAFTGEVSGRGGTQGFKVGEALGIIRPTKDAVEDSENGHDAHFDIYVEELEKHMNISLKEFSNFERKLQSWTVMGRFADRLLQSKGGPIKSSFGTDPMGVMN